MVSKKSLLVPIRKASLGVKYPPLPRWMERRRVVGKVGEGCEGLIIGSERRASVPKWMEKLPGNRKNSRKRSGRVASGGEGEEVVGAGGRIEKGGGNRRLSRRDSGGNIAGGSLW